jgi:hypothetical protein
MVGLLKSIKCMPLACKAADEIRIIFSKRLEQTK